MAARWWAGLDAAVLRELAAIADRDTRPLPVDPDRMASELADMLARDDRPTIGWYTRNYVRPVPTQRPPRPPKPAAVARVAFHMIAEGYEPRIVARTVYQAAVKAGMDHDDAVEATAVGIARSGMREQ